MRVKTDAHRREAEGSSGIVYMFSLDVARSPQQSVRSCAATAAGAAMARRRTSRPSRARAVGVVVIPERHPEPCPEPHAEFIGLSLRQPDHDRPAFRFDVRVPIVCPAKVCQKGAF